MFDYINAFSQAIKIQNAGEIASLLTKDKIRKSFRPHPSTYGLPSKIEKETNLERFCQNQLRNPFDKFLVLHLKGILFIHKNKFDEAYSFQKDLLNSFWRFFQSEPNATLLPVLLTLCTDLRILADKADEVLIKSAQEEDTRKGDALSSLRAIFSNLIKDNQKKIGVLGVVNNLFRIFFKLNNLKGCVSLIRALENMKEISINDFPQGQVVTYKFFLGRLRIYESSFKDAEKYLEEAFQTCTYKSMKNKKLILSYLIPVKILLGKMPTQSLLQTYDLVSQFSPLINAVKSGNVSLFNETLSKNELFFIHQGIYLLLEKTKLLVYRSLFKRIREYFDNTKIPISVFQSCLKWMNVELDTDEIECILANLIYSKFIKGYISHNRGFLVVSKNDPFPKIT